MSKWLLRILWVAPVLLVAGLSWADYTATQGTVAAFVCQTTKICPGVVLYDNTGTTQQGTSSAPLRIDPVGTTTQPVSGTVTAAQATAANLNATVVQPTAANLNATVAQATAANLNATVVGTVSGAVNVTGTDCSGSITTGGTAQNAFTAGATKHGFTIMNIDTTEVLWVSFTGTAAASGAASYALQSATATSFAAAGSFTSPPGLGLNTALSVVAATAGHKWSCTWW